MDVQPLIGHRPGLPAACEACVFWQEPDRTLDARRKERWVERIESRLGRYGVVVREDGEFRGLLQYGPPEVFRRAQSMPAGPPGHDAALVTCAYLARHDPVGVLERLLLEALADLKARGLAAVEAFALDAHDDSDERGPHHTLFDRAVLERLGFMPVRAEGPVTLMRLPLGGLQEAPARAASTASRLAALLLPSRVPAGSGT